MGNERFYILELQNFEDEEISGFRENRKSKELYTREEVIVILNEFLNFTNESVPEQQGGYDFENERWISGKEVVEAFISASIK